MGFWKHESVRLEELRRAVSLVVEESGEIEIDHETDEIERIGDDNDRAYAFAVTAHSAGRLGGTQEEVQSAVKKILEAAE